MARLSALLFLATLALLPWGGLLRLPWLHENAQWSDLVFSAAFLFWAGAQRAAARPRLRPVHAALALYLLWAALSFALASPRPPSGAAKLLGLAMLVALFLVSSDLLRRPGLAAAFGRTVAAGAILTALAALAGALVSGFGIATPLVGGCGDLLPGALSRAQAGFPHPNLLASFCIFASGVVAREDAGLARGLRRLAQAAIVATALVATSRAILGLALAFAIRRATTPPRRRVAVAVAAALSALMVGLTLQNVLVNPARPWQARLSPRPSVRLLAATSSLETLSRHPLLGTGPGSSPGLRGEEAFDAHLTPLNVAATLGLPALAALAFAVLALWRARSRPTDRVTWGTLAGLALDGLGQDVEDFRHVWIALGLADAGRRSDVTPGQDEPAAARPLRDGLL